MEGQLILPFTFNTQLSLAVVFLPLLSFMTIVLWPTKSKKAALVGTAFLSLSFLIALILFYNIWNQPPEHTRWIWFSLVESQFTAGIWLNNLSVLLLVLVTLVSVLVHLFSIEYMKDDKSFNRYFAFLGLFTFSMLGIVLADNLLLIFVFWELVGLSSYLLIGLYSRPIHLH